ncbi:MAG: hypothetical protein JO329_14980 [Planctomycetaceae bacterium]|nr:hypothetical protein [Planctomycetaceae bacterium]
MPKDSGLISASPDSGRFTAKRKTDSVLRSLRGEAQEMLSREQGITAGGWPGRLACPGGGAARGRA